MSIIVSKKTLPSCATKDFSVQKSLQKAIDANDTEKCAQLLRQATDLNVPLPNKEKPLHYALRLQRVDIVRKILEIGHAILQARREGTKAEPGKSANAPLARRASLHLDEADHRGLIPLHHAFRSANKDSITLLLGEKLGVSLQPVQLPSCLPSVFSPFARMHYFQTMKKVSAAAAQLSRFSSILGPQKGQLTGKITALHTELVQNFLGVRLRKDGSVEWTPLEKAILDAKAEDVKHLLHAGAPIRPITLRCLLFSKNLQIARLLLQHLKNQCVSVGFPDAAGKTLLHDAILAKNIPLARLLIACGASPLDPSWKDTAGNSVTPLDALFFLEAQQTQNKNLPGKMLKGLCVALMGLSIASVSLASLIILATRYLPDFSFQTLFFRGCEALKRDLRKCGSLAPSARAGCLQAVDDEYKADTNVLQFCREDLHAVRREKNRACQAIFHEEIPDCIGDRKIKWLNCQSKELKCERTIQREASQEKKNQQWNECIRATLQCANNIFDGLCTEKIASPHCPATSYAPSEFDQVTCQEKLEKVEAQCELDCRAGRRKKTRALECEEAAALAYLNDPTCEDVAATRLRELPDARSGDVDPPSPSILSERLAPFGYG